MHVMLDTRIPRPSIGLLEPWPHTICVVIKHARKLEMTEDDVPYVQKIDPETLVDGVRERVEPILPAGTLLVVTTGPIWVDLISQWRTPLRLLPRLDEVQVAVDHLLQTTRGNALAGWAAWSQRLFGERERRRINGEPDYQWPDAPYAGS